MTSHDEYNARRKAVFDLITQVVAGDTKRSDLPEAILDALDDANMTMPYGAFEVVMHDRAALSFEEVDGVIIGYNNGTPVMYRFPAGSEIWEV